MADKKLIFMAVNMLITVFSLAIIIAAAGYFGYRLF